MTRRIPLDGRMGMIAILGPRRMPYLRALHGLDALRRELAPELVLEEHLGGVLDLPHVLQEGVVVELAVFLEQRRLLVQAGEILVRRGEPLLLGGLSEELGAHHLIEHLLLQAKLLDHLGRHALLAQAVDLLQVLAREVAQRNGLAVHGGGHVALGELAAAAALRSWAPLEGEEGREGPDEDVGQDPTRISGIGHGFPTVGRKADTL